MILGKSNSFGQYVKVLRDFTVVNTELMQGYKEYVTCKAGSFLPVGNKGFFKKEFVILLPYEIVESSCSDIVKYYDYAKAVAEGNVEDRLYNSDEIDSNHLNIYESKRQGMPI